VLELGENEVGIERYLTKKEKKELEEKKLREEARIKEMQKNDANVRA
jgi:hypothetical protein